MPNPPEARLIFAMDATASREPTWDRASGWCHQMFDAVARIGGLDVQLVYFRGAFPPVAGPFESDARQPGRHREPGALPSAAITQIGRTLDHIAREHAKTPVAAFVYIGDTVEEAGDVLVRKAAGLGVKGFVFHEDPETNRGAVEILKAIAERTGGVYLPFDAGSAGKLGELLGRHCRLGCRRPAGARRRGRCRRAAAAAGICKKIRRANSGASGNMRRNQHET